MTFSPAQRPENEHWYTYSWESSCWCTILFHLMVECLFKHVLEVGQESCRIIWQKHLHFNATVNMQKGARLCNLQHAPVDYEFAISTGKSEIKSWIQIQSFKKEMVEYLEKCTCRRNSWQGTRGWSKKTKFMKIWSLRGNKILPRLCLIPPPETQIVTATNVNPVKIQLTGGKNSTITC